MPSPNTPRAADGWDPEDIKAAVRKRGVSLSELSRLNNLSHNACNFALRRQWPRAEAVIAKFIGVPASEIWPDRYTPDGRPTGPVRSTRSRPARKITARASNSR